MDWKCNVKSVCNTLQCKNGIEDGCPHVVLIFCDVIAFQKNFSSIDHDFAKVSSEPLFAIGSSTFD